MGKVAQSPPFLLWQWCLDSIQICYQYFDSGMEGRSVCGLNTLPVGFCILLCNPYESCILKGTQE